MCTPNLCPSCYSKTISVFYEIQNIPVNSMIMLNTIDEALKFPKGDIILGFCESCGFVFNLSFNPNLIEFSTRYESSQGYSPTFNTFHQDLAERLVNQFDLYNKDIIEIGCGQGEFLTLLCKIGKNRGVGFDPVYNNFRKESKISQDLQFINDFYSEEYSHIHGDFVCCKMTLEHIQDTAKFISMLHTTLSKQQNAIVFFQVPNAENIWKDVAFWDIYYEHSSYFSQGSLSRLFQLNGFRVTDIETSYDDQYIMITAMPTDKARTNINYQDDIFQLKRGITYFAENYQQKMDKWIKQIDYLNKSGKRSVIWGAGSKGVAFLTTLNITDQILYAVDINPLKNGTFVAGTGQKIVSPEFLREYKPETVVVMNPIYEKEIQKTLNNLGVNAKILVA